jgi:hypothetical protein
VLGILKPGAGPFSEEEVNLLSTLAGQLAVALQKSEGIAETERLAAQMATLYDVGLETAALQDLRLLFVRATQEAGRLIRSTPRCSPRRGRPVPHVRGLARDPSAPASPVFRPAKGSPAGWPRTGAGPINDPELSSAPVTRGTRSRALLRSQLA